MVVAAGRPAPTLGESVDEVNLLRVRGQETSYLPHHLTCLHPEVPVPQRHPSQQKNSMGVRQPVLIWALLCEVLPKALSWQGMSVCQVSSCPHGAWQ